MCRTTATTTAVRRRQPWIRHGSDGYLEMPTAQDNSLIQKSFNYLYPGKTEQNRNAQSKLETKQELGTATRDHEQSNWAIIEN
jgi:hypothetical protein